MALNFPDAPTVGDVYNASTWDGEKWALGGSGGGGGSSNFIQEGVGAVTRTMQDKVREHFSVTDFGAVGDGVTNCRAAFVAAWEAAKVSATLGFKVVEVPAGYYLIEGGTAQLYGGFGITLRGSGSGSTTIVNGNSNLPAIVFGDDPAGFMFANCVENIGFAGKVGVTGVAGQYGLVVNNQGHTRMKNIKAGGDPNKLYNGLRFNNLAQGQIGDLVSQGCDGDGIQFNGCFDVSGSSFRADSNGGYGFVFTKCGGMYLHGGSAYNNGVNAIAFTGNVGDIQRDNFFSSWVGDTSGGSNWFISCLSNSTFSQCWGSSQISTSVNPGAAGFFITSAFIDPGTSLPSVHNLTFSQITAIYNNGNGVLIYDAGGGGGSPRNLKFMCPTLGTEVLGNGLSGAAGNRYGLWVNGSANVSVIGGQALGNADGPFSNTSSGNFIFKDVTGVTTAESWQTQKAAAFKATTPPPTAWNFDGSDSTVVVGPGNAVLAVGTGLILITDTSVTGHSGIYMVSGGSATMLASVGGSFVAPTTTPAAGTYSIQYSSGSYRIFNGYASNVTFGLVMLRTRAAN